MSPPTEWGTPAQRRIAAICGVVCALAILVALVVFVATYPERGSPEPPPTVVTPQPREPGS